MEYHSYQQQGRFNSSSSSSRSPLQSHITTNHHITTAATTTSDPMQSWWESVSRARASIQTLLTLLPSSHSNYSLSSIADSDRPARSLLDSFPAYSAISSFLSSPLAGSGEDPLCHWLYDTFVTSDPDLRLVVLSFVPLIVGLYLNRVHDGSVLDPETPSLAGFEAVLLAVYAAEAKVRGGKAVTVSIPDLSEPSLYHAPRGNVTANATSRLGFGPSVGVLCPALEPHLAVKSTKRGFIVGVGLDCYYKVVSQMPSWSKVELCRFVATWAGEDCLCSSSLDSSGVNAYDDEVSGSCDVDDGDTDGGGAGGGNEIENAADLMEINDRHDTAERKETDGGRRIPLPWEVLQSVLRIMGHCLLAPVNSQVVKDAAAGAVRRLYARASHDLVPQAILATRSLIQIDNRARASARAAAIAAASSKASTPTKAKKPEVLLASK